MTRQGPVEESTSEGTDASLLAQHLDSRLASEESLKKAAPVRLACILSVDEALCDLVTFAFVTLHLFSAAGRHVSALVELLCIIEILE